MTTSLAFYGAIGVVITALAFVANRRLFAGGGAGGVSVLECIYYSIGLVSLGLGWYFNVRYVHQYGHEASYVNYTKALFSNWASDSPAQDYIIVNVILFPLWSIPMGEGGGCASHGSSSWRVSSPASPSRCVVPGVRRATDSLQPGRARRVEHLVPAVVAGDERDTGATMAARAAETAVSARVLSLHS
jgi:hypothetical protein